MRYAQLFVSANVALRCVVQCLVVDTCEFQHIDARRQYYAGLSLLRLLLVNTEVLMIEARVNNACPKPKLGFPKSRR